MTGNAKHVDVAWACIIAALLAGSLPLIQFFLGQDRAHYVPSGIAIALGMHLFHFVSFSPLLPTLTAVGMYLTPNWNLPRVIGAVVQAVWLMQSPRSHMKYMVVFASGLILGEGILSIFTALLKTTGVPPLTCIACPPNFCDGCE